MKTIFFMLLSILQGLCFASTDYEIKRFIVISIDALHPDSIKTVKPENIGNLMTKGVFNLKSKSVTPPKTLVSHTAMFTGLKPEDSGFKSNVWKKGDKKVDKNTIFNDVKRYGFKTYYIYSKEKLGFLENDAVDNAIFGKDDSVYIAEDILRNNKDKFFMFLHISGLDFAGAKYGWLSNEYLEEFKYIDEDLKFIIDTAIKNPDTAIIITSDHAGHERIHGSLHEEDMKLPVIVLEKNKKISEKDIENYESYKLKSLINKLLE